MNKSLTLTFLLLLLISLRLVAQSNKTVANGDVVAPISFSGAGCNYSWVNSDPAIGLPASGSGDIASFTATNLTSSPITATITATPSSSGFAYISNAYSNNISVIDVATNQIKATIPVESDPVGIWLTADGTKLFVTNSFSRSVSIVDTRTNAVTGRIATTDYCIGICVNKDGSRLYVCNFNNGTVSVYDTANGNTLATIPVGYAPYAICIGPDDSRVYVSIHDFHHTNPTTVAVINTQTNAIVTQIPVGAQPEAITINKNGTRVYVVNSASSSVSVINTADNTVVETIGVGYQPHGVAISPDGTKLYTRNAGQMQFWVTNLVTKARTSTSISGYGAVSCGLSADGNFAYIPNQNDRNVSVVDTRTFTEVKVIPVNDSPTSLGNFVSAGVGCQPQTFTITVDPAPSLTIGNVTGGITSCSGAPSIATQQLVISGSWLKGNVSIAAPAGFEVSSSSSLGFGATLAIGPTNGSISSDTVYIRSAGGAAIGVNEGDLVFSSNGVADQTAKVSAVINPVATVDAISGKNVKDGETITDVIFAGNADKYQWVNDEPGIGLPASGNDDIKAFTAINKGKNVIVATIVVTPVNNSGCNGMPRSFTITVQPDVPVIPPVGPAAEVIFVNTFTPNGDGVNDTWVIQNSTPATIVKVFNRYGQLVFSSKGYTQPWNGQNGNKNVPTGTYYYVIETDNSKKLSGYVTVIR